MQTVPETRAQREGLFAAGYQRMEEPPWLLFPCCGWFSSPASKVYVYMVASVELYMAPL